MTWPNDLIDDLPDIPSGARMDTAPYQADVVLAKIVDYIELFIAEFGANPSGTFATIAARLDAMISLTGGTVGSITMGSGATLTLEADPTDNMHAVTKQYLDDRIAALFPGGVTGTPTTGDTYVYNGTNWPSTPTGL